MSPGYVARFSAVMLTRLVLCGSMQFPDFPHQEYLEIPGGWGAGGICYSQACRRKVQS